MIKNRGHFPNDESIVKLLWLAICNIEDKRARQREKEKQALAQLALVYPERINRYL